MSIKLIFSLFIMITSIIVNADEINNKKIKEEDNISLSEIIVTAEKQEEELKNVPININLLNKDNINEENIIDTYDIVNAVPGLSMIKTGHHGLAGFLSLRGITPTMEGDQSLGYFVDDIYFPMFDSEILDIKRIEVLKGPQGTLYGKNTESGVINIITNKPQNKNSALISIDIGNNNTQKYKTIVNRVINDKFYVRGAFRKYLSDGYFTNKNNSNDKTDEIDGYDGRLSFRYLPSDNWDLILSYDKSDYDNGYNSFNTLENARKNPGDVNTDYEGYSKYKNDRLFFKSVYDNDDLTFTSLTAVSKTKNDDLNDIDFTTTDSMRLQVKKDTDFLSQEFRLGSNIGNKFSYLLGTYLSKQKDKQYIDTQMRQGMPSFSVPPFSEFRQSNLDTDTYALFTQGNYKFNDLFNITAGLRYNIEDKKIDFNRYYSMDLSALGMISTPAKKSEKFKQLLPKISFNFNLENHLIYASFSKGYKSGGFNPLVSSTKYLKFDEEESYNYEVGIKSTLLDDKLFSNLSFYHIDIDNQQVELQSYPTSTTTNAGKSKINGVDLELKYQATNDWLFKLGGAYNHARFDEYKFNNYNTSGVLLGIKDYSGKMPTNTLVYSYNISAKYNFNKDTYILGKVNGYGKMYYDLDNAVKEDSYATVDLTLATKVKGFGVKLWGKNIFDEGYTTRAFEMSNVWYARAGSPRTFGLTLSKKF